MYLLPTTGSSFQIFESSHDLYYILVNIWRPFKWLNLRGIIIYLWTPSATYDDLNNNITD
jgi:hypothetical protein